MRRITLTDEQRQKLVEVRDTNPTPYHRERAAAVLKIAAGEAPARVARQGLLRAREPDTLYRWLNRFQEGGIKGLLEIKPGRGRKPAYGDRTPAQAKATILDLVRRAPTVCGIERSRWRLQDLLAIAHEQCDLSLLSVSGMHRLLDRLDISYKRGRDYVHSPDPDYPGKRDYLNTLLAQARASGGEQIFLFLDELTYYRHPSLAAAYEERGARQPLARRGYGHNTATRVIGALNAQEGQVHFWQGTVISIPRLVQFYRDLRSAYPDATQILIALDNWPVHFHPDVLVALAPQQSPWPLYRPANWPTAPSEGAVRKWGNLQLPIQLIPLPTYASWLNPIEKLWRKGKQDVLHLHRCSDQIEALRARFAGFLTQFAAGSAALLRYVGLAPALP